MRVTLVGIGCGNWSTLTKEVEAAMERADLYIGAKRILQSVPDKEKERVEAVRAEEIFETIKNSEKEEVCVLFSGDTGFYSGSKKLVPMLREAGMEFQILPGISSVVTLSARIRKPWQDWKLCSAHGVDCDVVGAVMEGKDTFFLTGGEMSPEAICRKLCQAGLGHLQVVVGENLSYPDEAVLYMTAEGAADWKFEPLSVLYVEAAKREVKRTPGYPDDAFIRDKVPMTKQEVRAAVLAKLAITPEDVCWDIGAGSGSVSVEMAQVAREVWAVEQKDTACELIKKNKQKFGVWNLNLVQAKAPEGLDVLPTPDVVFIGGSSGNMKEILDTVLSKNPKVRICISAICLETLSIGSHLLEEAGFEVEIAQISVSRTKNVGDLHMLMAQNPVFLISNTAEQ